MLVTQNQSGVTLKADETSQKVVTSSRAHALLTEGKKLCHNVTGCDTETCDVTCRCDSDTRPPEGAGVTITLDAAAERKEEHRRRMSLDPRFAGWAAGSAK
jgi:hypothetical protein